MSRINVARRIAAKNMNRKLHVHHFGKATSNGRIQCTSCPYFVPRWQTYIRKDRLQEIKREAKWNKLTEQAITTNAVDVFVNTVEKVKLNKLEKLTVPALRELASKQFPNLKGISKMRRHELLTVLSKPVPTN